MQPLPPEARRRLLSTLALLESDAPGEVLAAAGRARQILGMHGLRLCQLEQALDLHRGRREPIGEPATYNTLGVIEMLERLQRVELPDGIARFVESVRRQMWSKGKLSQKQADAIRNIWKRNAT